MVIPKGSAFEFLVTVLEKDSFLPKNISGLDTTTSSFKIIRAKDTCIMPGTITLVVTDAVNGKLKIVMPAAFTATLDTARGEAVDNYYLKPLYKGVLELKFADGNERTAIIEKIYVAPTGVTCG